MRAPSSVAATDLWRLSAIDIATLVRRREVSVREVIEAHLRRIDAVNPPVNAVVVRLDEQALTAADAAAGAIPIGRTNLATFTVRRSTHTRHCGGGHHDHGHIFGS